MKEINEILYGIDKDESKDPKGWWPTSTGVEFGKNKLSEVNEFVDGLRSQLELAKEYIPDEYKYCDGTIKEIE